jgi:hypothetical protein
MMFSTPFELLLIVAAFILGGFEGQRLWAWLKSWFFKEVDKVTGHTGPTGA